MSYIGDIRLGDTIDIKFTTVNTSGAPTQLAGSPVVSAYPGNSTTQITTGITLTVDFDSVTGLNNVRVVASSGNGYATATNYSLVITTGTVGGASVVGYVVGEFSIEARSAIMPTTAARTLDVSATGEAGIDWSNIGSPTTAVNLSGTNIDVDQVVASVSGAVGSVTGAVGSVTGNVGGSIGSLAAQAQTDVEDAVWDATLTDHLDSGSTGAALNAAGSAGDPWGTALPGAYGAGSAGYILGTNLDTTISSRSTVTTAQVNAEVDTALADVNLDHLVGTATGIPAIPAGTYLDQIMDDGTAAFDRTTDSLQAIRDRGDSAWDTATGFSTLDAAGVRSAVGLASANLDTQLDALPTAAENAAAVWDETLSGHLGAGSTGAALNNASAPTVQEIVDGVWDEPIADHLDSGSTGEALNAAGGAGDPWITALPGSYTSGQAGYIVGTNLNATVSSRATQTSVDNVQSDTNDIQTRIPAALDGGRMDVSVGAMATDVLTAAALNADAVAEIQSGLSTLTAAQVWDLTDGIETGLTPRQATRLIAAALAGKLSGAATVTVTIRNAVADDTNRITATVDSDGNRTAITYNL